MKKHTTNDMIDCLKIENHFDDYINVPSKLIFSNQLDTAPLFTIIIPTFKRTNYLKQSLESAINQLTDINYEIIVGDNNPEETDDTARFLLRYKETKGLIYYKHESNIGMDGNWNRLFKLSRSKWTIMLHDDDILSPYYIDTIKEYIADDIAIIKPNVPKFYTEKCFEFQKPVKIISKTIKWEDFLWGCALGAPSHMTFNTQEVIELGGYRMNYYPCIDYEFNLKAAYYSKVVSLSEILGGYRVSNNESLNPKTMSLYWENRRKISGYLFKYMGVSQRLIPIIHYLTFKYFIKDINNKYNYDFKPDRICYWIPTQFNRIFIKTFSLLAHRCLKRRNLQKE